MTSPAARPRAKKLSEEELAAEQAQIEAENRRTNAHVPLEDQVEGEPEETVDAAANRGNSTTKPQRKGRPKKDPPAPRTFKIADIVGPMAKLLIDDHFPELAHLDIRYIFTSRAAEIDKKPVITKSKKLDGVSAWFANGSVDGEPNPFFYIEISETHWNSMGRGGKEAFLDDALANFGTSNKGALKMVRRDIQEHSSVLARHGLYTAELKAQRKMLASAVLQPTLDVQEGGA